MEILRLLDQADWVDSYEVQDYRRWSDGLYYRLKIQFNDDSVLFVREYVDTKERVYAFHWQNQHNNLIMRWDNAPHHKHIETFPHHKHTPDGVMKNREIDLEDVLAEIQQHIKEQ